MANPVNDDERPMIRWLRHFVMALFLIGTPFIEVMMIKNLAHARRSNSWPTTEGVVSKSEVALSAHGTSPVFSPDVVYDYQVGGRSYEGRQVRVGNMTSKVKSDAEKIVGQYPVGSKPPVHYNPDDPKESCLIPGAEWMHYVVVVSPLLFLIVSVGYFHQMWRNRNTSRAGTANADWVG